jgi:hypothetical protein
MKRENRWEIAFAASNPPCCFLLLVCKDLAQEQERSWRKIEKDFTEGTERAAIAPSGSRRFRFVMETLPA